MDSLAELSEQIKQVTLNGDQICNDNLKLIIIPKVAPKGSVVHELCSSASNHAVEGIEEEAPVEILGTVPLRKSSSASAGSPRRALSRRRRSHGSIQLGSPEKAEQLDLPIVDVKILFRGEKVPEGYTKIMQLGDDFPADLTKPLRNIYAGPINVLVKRGSLRPPVTNVLIAFLGKGEHVPPGFEAIVKTVSGQSADLSACFPGPLSRTYLCVSKGSGPPVCNLVLAKANSDLPGSHVLLERSPLGYSTLFYSGKLTRANFGLAISREMQTAKPHVPEEEDVKQFELLAHGCYSSHVGTVLVCLCSIERALSAIDVSKEVLDFLLKLTLDCMYMGLDVVIHRAMRVIQTVSSLHMSSDTTCNVLVYIAKAVVYTKCFFGSLPSQLYSTVDDDTATSHTGSNGSPARSSKGRSSVGSQSSDFELELDTSSIDQGMTLAQEDADEIILMPESITTAIALAKSDNAQEEGGTTEDIGAYIKYDVLYGILDVVDGIHVAAGAHATLSRFPAASEAFAIGIVEHSSRIFTGPERQRVVFMLLLAKLADADKSGAALELLSCLLLNSASLSEPVFAYHVRLFVFDAVLSCLPHLNLLDSLLNLFSVLWKHYRTDVVLEFGVVVQVVLVDALTNKETKEEVKQHVLEEVQKWLGNHAVDLVQFYLNFENDPFVATWRSFQDLLSAICSIACSTSSLQPLALQTLVTVMRLLADASANVHLIAVDAGLRQESKWEWAACASPSVRRRHVARDRSSRAIKTALECSRVSKSLKALVSAGILKNSPNVFAEALHTHRAQLGEKEIGEYLGETGVSEEEKAFHEELRVEYTRLLPFHETSFEGCLRLFLTRGGFRLPGEGQKIGAILAGFAKWFMQEQPGSFPTEDVAFMLAYSMVMLNTSLHNKCAKSCQFDKNSFYNMLCNIPDHNFSQQFSDTVFESIQANEIKLPTASDKDDNDAEVEESWTMACRRAGALISAGRSRRKVCFHREMSGDCVRLMLQVVWMHAFSVVTALLESPGHAQWSQPSHELVCLALDLLRHCLSACLFLGLNKERAAFASLLAKLHYMQVGVDEDDDEKGVVKGRPLDRRWLSDVLERDDDSEKDVITVISEVHEVTKRLKDSVLRREQEEKLLAIQKRFHGSAEIMGHGKRAFIREGQLIKRCSRKDKRYQFFLFSDALVYASQKLTTQKYVVHRSLPLQTMRIVDTLKQPSRAFEICSPVKSIIVQALTFEDKRQWIQHLTAAINALTGRKENLIMNKATALQDLVDDSDSEEELHREEEDFVLVQTGNSSEQKVDAEILEMDGASLEKMFVKALKCSKPILLNKHTGVQATDNDKLLLYAYFKQATAGDCVIENASPRTLDRSRQIQGVEGKKGDGQATSNASLCRALEQHSSRVEH